MNRMEEAELADECERIVAPSRELDAAIARAVGYEVEWATIGPDHRREELVQVRTYPGEAAPTSRNLRRYTASLDAAMTLVPEGCAINVVRTADGQSAHANLYRFDGNSDCIPSAKFGGSATTTALALCAAALKSLAQKEGE